MITLRAAVVTLGCRLNQSDTALLCGRLKKMGFEIVQPDSSESPNLIIVNTCTITATAYKKSKQALRSLRAQNPQSFIVLTGCAADVDKDDLDGCDEYDLLLCNEDKKNIARILPHYLACLNPAAEEKDVEEPGCFRENALSDYPFKTRAFLKIQEGCNNFCSYCVVPYARGRERSRDLDEVIREFQTLSDAGYHEIVLTGVNTCTYCCGDVTLPRLLEKLIALPGNARIRLSSTEPGPVLKELVQVMRTHPDRICSFLHLPIQSGSDSVLKRMNRHYTVSEYESMIAEARKELPNLHVGTDLIVGFPGETAGEFQETLETLERIRFANIHIFPYSPRKGTPASDMPERVTGEELESRLTRARGLKESMARAFAESLIGSEESVIVEAMPEPGVWEGWSGNYVRTRIKSKHRLIRQYLHVKFDGVAEDGAVEASIMEDR